MNHYSRLIVMFVGLVQNSICELKCPFARDFDDCYNRDRTTVNNLPYFTCATPPSSCSISKYRSIDGSCNNLNNPGWGMGNTRYVRFLSPNYGDGFSSPTLAVSGDELPSARLTSNKVFTELSVLDQNLTLLNMQWGQSVSHDMSLLAGSTSSIRKLTQCCTADGKMLDASELSPFCYPISVPHDDPYGSELGTECQNFVRTLTDVDMGCDGAENQEHAEQLSIVTPLLDLSHVYGENLEWSNQLRSFKRGHLRTDRRHGRNWLPAASDSYDSCNIENPDEICYFSGDVRVNQNPGLTVLSTILVLEHNRLAFGLSKINPHWSDEKLFQEARRINIAEYQAITYYDWLPLLLGDRNLIEYGLIYKNTDGCYVNDYDDSVSPAVFNEHATAGFRYFHSQIEGHLNLMQPDASYNASLRLSNFFFKPMIIEENGTFDQLLRGLVFQPQQDTDDNYDKEIRDYWFRLSRKVGDDLRAIDIQRNRDHGLRSFNDYRVWIGKPRATKWEDYLDTCRPESLDLWKSVYASFEDVDLTVAASAEIDETDSLAGSVFNVMLIEQFHRSRVSDRYFFENGSDKHTRFTLEQLKQIRKSSAARLICNNSKHLKYIQAHSFELVSDLNPLVKCRSLPNIDLGAWKERTTNV